MNMKSVLSKDLELVKEALTWAPDSISGTAGNQAMERLVKKLSWQPIASAPKDQVILTNEGTGKFVDQRGWGSPVTNGWYLCDLHGDIPSCAEDGMRVSAIEPKYWMDILSI